MTMHGDAVLFATSSKTALSSVAPRKRKPAREAWDDELEQSPRPSALKQAIRAFTLAMAALAAGLVHDVAVPDSGSPLTVAHGTERSIAKAIAGYLAAAHTTIGEHAPAVAAELAGYLEQKTGGVHAVSADAIQRSLTETIAQYVQSDATELGQSAGRAIAAWQAAGGTQAELRDYVQNALSGEEYQVKRTIVTEIQTAYIGGTKRQFARAGVEKVERIAMPNACDRCAELAGVHDADDPDLYEAHPNCLPGDTLVSGSPPLASAGRWYEGDLVEIETVGGHVVSATPNHPVLTTHGFVAAGLLREGSDVLCCAHRERMLPERPHNDQIPSRIEDVARSLSGAAGVPTVRVPVAAVDFHGDGVGSQVAVIRTNRQLRRHEAAAFYQPAGELALVLRDAVPASLPRDCTPLKLGYAPRTSAHRSLSGQGVPRALVGRQLGHPQRLCLRHRAELEAGFKEARPNGAATHAVPTSDGLLAFAGDVRRDYLGARERQASAIRSADLPGDTHASAVSRVARRRFAGHVYNLQTAPGWYVANGIITHNCQCDWQPAPDDAEVEFSRIARGPVIALSKPGTARGGIYVLAGGGS